MVQPVLSLTKRIQKMEQIILKTDLSCKHCVMKVEPVLKSEPGIENYSINLEHPDRLVTITFEDANIDSVIAGFKAVGYSAEKI